MIISHSYLASSAIALTGTATVTITRAVTSIVSTATATPTAYGDSCAILRQLAGKLNITNGGIVEMTVLNDTTDPEDCCYTCENKAGCVYYEVRSRGTECRLYTTGGSPSNACRSDRCTSGVQHYDGTTPQAGGVVYVGTCLVATPGGSLKVGSDLTHLLHIWP
jgi:hypothetical protein